MRLLLKSTAARLLAVRQVTQLNAGKKTAGVDGKASLSFEQRFELSEQLNPASDLDLVDEAIDRVLKRYAS
jgi:retron-type reverse transcriptase